MTTAAGWDPEAATVAAWRRHAPDATVHEVAALVPLVQDRTVRRGGWYTLVLAAYRAGHRAGEREGRVREHDEICSCDDGAREFAALAAEQAAVTEQWKEPT